MAPTFKHSPACIGSVWNISSIICVQSVRTVGVLPHAGNSELSAERKGRRRSCFIRKILDIDLVLCFFLSGRWAQHFQPFSPGHASSHSYTGSHLISYLMLGIPNCELERRKGRGNDSCGKCSHRFSSFPL